MNGLVCIPSCWGVDPGQMAGSLEKAFNKVMASGGQLIRSKR